MAEPIPEGIGLAITLLQGSIDSLRGEVAQGLTNISTRLDSKADRVEAVALVGRLDRVVLESDARYNANDKRLRQLEDAQLKFNSVETHVESEQRRKLTFWEKLAATFGTIYIGGMPFVIWLLQTHAK